MKQWEYLCTEPENLWEGFDGELHRGDMTNPEVITEWLNYMASEGWELVSIERLYFHGGFPKGFFRDRYVFKRPL